MRDPHWENLQQIFHAAIALAPHERADYLNQACSGDLSLRQAVESLLKSHEETDNFVDMPAYQAAAEMLLDDEDLKSGQTISHYRILSLLGEGGMGTVYLAEDTKLHRNVSLKFLSANFTQDQERLRRFEQEGRAISALNHPNTLTIHEISETDGRRFIATEFIEGQTLRERLRSGLDIDEALDIAVQVASALAAAHRVNIVHRDIKPENVMIRKDDGLVKVLDFGLAKVSEPPAVAGGLVDREAETRMRANTAPGVVMGTVAYMSPEQARGDAVDERTDIWSLGVVLYEMVAGCSPFVAATSNEIISTILSKEPTPSLARYSRLVPERLEEIVQKALTKNRDERYQTSKELLIDLKRLKQSLELKGIERSASSEANGGRQIERAGDGAVTSAADSGPAALGTGYRHSVSSAEYIVSEIKQHKQSAAIVFTLFLVAAAALGFGLYKLGIRNQRKPSAAFQTIRISRLTNTGNIKGAIISPDSKYVAYVIDDAGRQSLWVRHISTSSIVQTVPPAEAEYYGITFSPDGGYVYYDKQDKNGLMGVLHRVPVLGGNSRRVLEDIDGPIAFSPDGKQIAFVRLTLKAESYLMVANSDGSDVRILATRKVPSKFNGRPAWSPDGGAIFCPGRNRDAGGQYANVVKVRVADGTEEQFTSQRWQGVQEVAWLRDGGGLLVNANTQIWHLSYPEGAARKVTNDSNNYSGVSVSTDSSVMVTTQTNSLSSIWVMASDGANRSAEEVTTKTGNEDPVWTADGKIIYASNANGNWDLWVMDPDGGNRKQLTLNAGRNGYPSVPAEGQYVVFVSNQSGFFHVWRMDKDGSNLKQLTNGGGEAWPVCSPDGRWVMYVQLNQGEPTLWKIPLDGGTPVQLTDKFSGAPQISPDGKLVACIYFNEPSTLARLALISSEDGKPVKLFDIQPTAVLPNSLVELGVIRWTTDGKAITYVDTREGVSNIWRQPLDGGKPVQLTDFKSDRILSFDWSRDGKQLALGRGTNTNDVVLISSMK
jgi:serine/threonine protein kinase